MCCSDRFIRLLAGAFVVLLVACQSRKTEDTLQSSSLDSILEMAGDTLMQNPMKGKAMVDSAGKWISDSIDYWNVRSFYARYYFLTGNIDSGKQITDSVIRSISKAEPSSRQRELLAGVYNLYGYYYNLLNELDSSRQYFTKSIQYVQKPVNRYDALINLADNHIRSGDYDEGVTLYMKALRTADSLRADEHMLFPVYMGLAQSYMTGMRDYSTANQYFLKAESTIDHRTLFERFSFYNNRGNYYYFNEEYRKALGNFLKALSIAESVSSSYSIHLCYTNLGDIYYQLQLPDSSHFYLDQSYNFNTAVGDSMSLFYVATFKAAHAINNRRLYEANQWLANYPTRLKYGTDLLMIRYKELMKAYDRVGLDSEAYRYSLLFNQLNDSARSVYVQNAFGVVEASYKQDTLLMRKEIELENKNHELSVLRQGTVMLVLLLVLVAIALVFLYLWLRRRRETQLLRHHETTSRLRLQNIRNRISPHFIFNILNKFYQSEASSPLYDLIKLLRKSLEMTEDVSIKLSDEISFVQLYLQLANVKPARKFYVNWEIDTTVRSDDWEIPSMIMQIPVENALRHALPEGDEGLELQIVIRCDEGWLHIEINDNGIGYMDGVRSSTRGTGTGLKVLHGTINILNQNNSQPISFRLINRSQEGGRGTSVRIDIPAGYDYGS